MNTTRERWDWQLLCSSLRFMWRYKLPFPGTFCQVKLPEDWLQGGSFPFFIATDWGGCDAAGVNKTGEEVCWWTTGTTHLKQRMENTLLPLVTSMVLRNAGTSLGPLKGLWTMKPTHLEEGRAERWQEPRFATTSMGRWISQPSSHPVWVLLVMGDQTFFKINILSDFSQGFLLYAVKSILISLLMWKIKI